MDNLRSADGEQTRQPPCADVHDIQSMPGERPAGERLYTIDEAITDAIEQISGEPFPDPFTGEHEIEYWIWTGNRLVPASPDTVERLRQQEELLREEARLAREQRRTLPVRLRQWSGQSLLRVFAAMRSWRSGISRQAE